jgi:hypothetical protein
MAKTKKARDKAKKKAETNNVKLLEAILGNEFLFRNKNVKSIILKTLEMFNGKNVECIEFLSDRDKYCLNHEENMCLKAITIT